MLALLCPHTGTLTRSKFSAALTPGKPFSNEEPAPAVIAVPVFSVVRCGSCHWACTHPVAGMAHTERPHTANGQTFPGSCVY
jgi:hypothetical protein